MHCSMWCLILHPATSLRELISATFMVIHYAVIHEKPREAFRAFVTVSETL